MNREDLKSLPLALLSALFGLVAVVSQLNLEEAAANLPAAQKTTAAMAPLLLAATAGAIALLTTMLAIRTWRSRLRPDYGKVAEALHEGDPCPVCERELRQEDLDTLVCDLGHRQYQ